MNDFSKDLNNNLNSQYISPKILLDKLRLLDEDSRKSAQYQDPFYLPFYFHLSKYIFPKNVLQSNLNLGLEISCFLQGNKTIEKFFGFQNYTEEFYSNRIAFSNIKSINKKIALDYYFGKIYDLVLDYNFDLIIVNEKSNFDKINDMLNIFWNKLNLNGCLVMDFLSYDKKIKNIFLDFCKSNNRQPVLCKTRYVTGIVIK
jgi:hypothetical protein